MRVLPMPPPGRFLPFMAASSWVCSWSHPLPPYWNLYPSFSVVLSDCGLFVCLHFSYLASFYFASVSGENMIAQRNGKVLEETGSRLIHHYLQPAAMGFSGLWASPSNLGGYSV